MANGGGIDSDEACRPWRRRISSVTAMSWPSACRAALLLLLVAAVTFACVYLPVEQCIEFPPPRCGYVFKLHALASFLESWGSRTCYPTINLRCNMALAYIPLTVLAVPASVLTLGGGYLFGFPIGFVADSIGATLGAAAALVLGRTIGRSYVISKLKNYPKFQAVSIAIQRSGFKIVLLLRFVPLLPFNMLNYLLSVTPVHMGEYILATWLGMMPITAALVYVGTTLKNLSDVTHGWNEFSIVHWVLIVLGLTISAILIVCVTRVARASLEKALAENVEIDGFLASPQLPIVVDPSLDLQMPLIINIDPAGEAHER